MEKGVIRYHPLISGDTENIEQIPLFSTTSLATIQKNHAMYLSEMITNYYRLHAKKTLTQKATDSMTIHCPKCGSTLKRISQNLNSDNLGLYTCSKCRR